MPWKNRSEVRQHSTRQSCWVIINGTVYDVTAFVNDHPGGASILLKYAGRDATEAFAPVHQIDTIPRYLTPQQNLGAVSDSDVDETIALPVQSKNKEEKKARLSSIINISDFEYAAIQHLPPTSFACKYSSTHPFLKSGAEDEHATTWNRDSWKAIRLRPRILRPIETINIATSILDTSFSAPFFICPAGGAKLAHPDGDLCLTRAAARHGILHWTCSNSSFPLPEMASARAPGQTTYWQIYAAADLAVTEEQVKRAVQLGYKGFALTVDAIWSGKRESDLRANSLLDDDDEDAGEEEEEEDTTFAKEPTVKRPPVWSRFNWVSAITWLRTLTDLPIAIKGIQTWEDAALCMQHPGVHPWLSNHGGRQIDSAPSAAETLVSMHQHCPEVFTKCNVIVDGGITRGADIVKALALGATAVGLGRGFLYSIVFGDAGASKAIRILVHEIETTMALLGITSLQELDSSYVSASHFFLWDCCIWN
ncbi:oxidoreductase [Aspergillus cavernicola]|uniref:Oxidoreductase n=1 Tax=Aspergillus cavernicola TaxID=176166 RepID=A0ABR4ICP2_9EURO